MDVNAYVECMSRPKNVTLMKFLKILSIMLFAGFLILGLLLGGSAGLIAFIIMILSAAGIWFFGLRASVEYEYQYVDRELTVDVIYNKSRRKNVATYDLNKLEIFAPIHSHQLDEYKNRQLQVKDYAAEETKPDPRYVMIIDGKEKLIIEPTEALVQAVKSIAPRKVYTD